MMIRIMAKVPDPRRNNRSVGCYGKGQSILVEKLRKTEVNEISRKGKYAKKLVKNSSKIAEKRKWGWCIQSYRLRLE